MQRQSMPAECMPSSSRFSTPLIQTTPEKRRTGKSTDEISDIETKSSSSSEGLRPPPKRTTARMSTGGGVHRNRASSSNVPAPVLRIVTEPAVPVKCPKPLPDQT